jgi:cytochrome c biogenesis protein ResB
LGSDPSRTRETRVIALLIAATVASGSLLQLFVAPGPRALVASTGIAGAVLVVLGLALRGRLQSTLSSFRFVSVVLAALALAAILGTFVLQGKPPGLYRAKYNVVVSGLRLPIGDAILALCLDDIFHSLWFGGLLALFGAAVIVSAVRRWPVRIGNVGFFLCHLGLIAVLSGAALSAAFSARGRLDLYAGGQTVSSVNGVQHGLFDTQGRPVTSSVPLGFDLRLDRFEVVRYGPEYRIGYYEKAGDEPPRLRASFEPVAGARHRLPGGAVFLIGSLSKDSTAPAVVLAIDMYGRHFETPPLSAEKGDFVTLPDERGIITFERASDEVKSFRSEVTAFQGDSRKTAAVAVNDPFSFGGWTLYQSSYSAADPTYSGLEAVHDPGVTCVFFGFALMSLGVIALFYVEPRLNRRAGAG